MAAGPDQSVSTIARRGWFLQRGMFIIVIVTLTTVGCTSPAPQSGGSSATMTTAQRAVPTTMLTPSTSTVAPSPSPSSLSAWSSSSTDGDGPKTGLAAQSFWGDWYVHGATYQFGADGTGLVRAHRGFAANGGEWVNEVWALHLAMSADATVLSAKITKVSFEKIALDGKATPIPPPPDTTPSGAAGAIFRITVVRPHLLKATTVKGRGDLGNPYICDVKTARSDSDLCGA